MTEPELDTKLAAKLRAAAEQEPYRVLDEDARARVLRTLQREPRRVKRFPWVNVSMAVAAAALIALMLRPRGPECALPTTAAFANGALELGAFGHVVVEDGAVVEVSRAEACALEITLARGTLGAALHDLKPASLTVRTPLGAVEVHGTTFSVAVQDQLEVVLLEGAVALREDATATMLDPGHTLTRRAGGTPETGVVQPTQERKLRALLDGTREPPIAPAVREVEPPQVETRVETPAAPKNATELLAAAERSRRAGELTRARSLYREAGGAKGADAEVALLRWARLELESSPDAALEVLARYRTRYGRKLERARLGAEASFLEMQVLAKLGRRDEAHTRAQELIRRYPDSPHAGAAAAW